MANHLTPEELSKEVGIERDEVSRQPDATWLCQEHYGAWPRSRLRPRCPFATPREFCSTTHNTPTRGVTKGMKIPVESRLTIMGPPGPGLFPFFAKL